MNYKRWLILIPLCVILACNSNKDPYQNNLGVEPSLIAQIDTAHYTLIKWKDSVINFGTLKMNDSLNLKYKFQNIGTTPLYIIKARPSCGCTITHFEKEPIMPGKYGFITAQMKSGFHTGEINKTILVTSNTKNHKNTLLIIRGVILPADKK